MIFKFTLFFIISSFGLIQCAEYYDVAGRRYHVSYPSTASYYGALKYCNSEGMYLLDIISGAENLRVTAILNAVKQKYNEADSFWTSATDLGSEGIFYWATNGHPMHLSYWGANQPDNHYKSNRNLYENCVSIENTLTWNDSVCEDEKYFICRDTFDVPVFTDNRCSNITVE